MRCLIFARILLQQIHMEGLWSLLLLSVAADTYGGFKESSSSFCCSRYIWRVYGVFFFFLLQQIHMERLWGLLLLSVFPAVSLGFTIFRDSFAYVTVFNPTVEVVTFRLRGWRLLGMFLLQAFNCLGHECQDLLKPCNGMDVSTD